MDSPEYVHHLPVRFEGYKRWAILLPFFPGGQSRVGSVLSRVARLPEREVKRLRKKVLRRFTPRHANLDAAFDEHYRMGAVMIGATEAMSEERRRLAGAYFTMEYAVASAALFNPSIVEHPDQTGVPDGGLRFILSLRATGEGHVSSIVFRTGLIQPDHSVEFDPPGAFPRRARLSPDQWYERPLFRRKLREMAVDQREVELVMSRLPERFTLPELEQAIVDSPLENLQTIECMRWLARENYRLRLSDDADLSQTVIFPQSENEHRGIEDLRLVRFVDDDGSVRYYGTYNAYNGYRALPQLMETTDLRNIRIHTLNGAGAQDKGMALFPRRIGGHYVMCSRIDGVNLYIAYSDIPAFWESASLLCSPKYPWEFMQIGNCGSPIETDAGWLLLTHGVGPLRTYSIGAMLLDRDNPRKVLGRLDTPLLAPNEEEQEGYTPNVVYTCGALVHGDSLYMPYAVSDSVTGFAVVELKRLLERLCR